MIINTDIEAATAYTVTTELTRLPLPVLVWVLAWWPGPFVATTEFRDRTSVFIVTSGSSLFVNVTPVRCLPTEERTLSGVVVVIVTGVVSVIRCFQDGMAAGNMKYIHKIANICWEPE